MWAYYVEWYMREAWRELMFADTDQQAKTTSDPEAPANRSKAALAKAAFTTTWIKAYDHYAALRAKYPSPFACRIADNEPESREMKRRRY